MWWLKAAWGLVTGNIGTIVNAITGVVGKLSDNDTARQTAELHASVQTWQARVDLFKGMSVIQWLIAAALVPPLVHQGMIYLDSTPFPYIWVDGWPVFKMHLVGTWNVPKAPAPYDEREWAMIGSLLGISSGLGIAKVAAKTAIQLFK